MKFTPETASDILNTLVENSPEFANIISMMVAHRDERTKLRNELLQHDQNLADDISKYEDTLKSIDESITSIMRSLNLAKGKRLSVCKKLTALRREREEVHKAWLKNGFSQT